MNILEQLKEPWPWYTSGIVIVSIMFLLIFFGQSFGFSSNLRTICSAAGLGKKVSFFNFDWKKQTWNLVFLIGAIIGGFIAGNFLNNNEPIQLSQNTIADLKAYGFSEPTAVQPNEIFSIESLMTLKGFLILAIGGFMVGFGSRYAGGCTSGHAISGLSDLQLPSLIAVIGFFAGGLIMSHLLFPLIF